MFSYLFKSHFSSPSHSSPTRLHIAWEILRFILILNYGCIHSSVSGVCACGCLRRPGDMWCLGAGVTGAEPPNMGAGNRTQVLCKYSMALSGWAMSPVSSQRNFPKLPRLGHQNLTARSPALYSATPLTDSQAHRIEAAEALAGEGPGGLCCWSQVTLSWQAHSFLGNVNTRCLLSSQLCPFGIILFKTTVEISCGLAQLNKLSKIVISQTNEKHISWLPMVCRFPLVCGSLPKE